MIGREILSQEFETLMDRTPFELYPLFRGAADGDLLDSSYHKVRIRLEP